MIKGNDYLNEFVDRYVKGGNPLVGPASIDLTIADDFKKIVEEPERIVNLGEKVEYVNSSGILYPGEFCLATTAERVSIPNEIAGFVVGRSSLARQGIQVECAGYIDPGFRGTITMEVFNQSPNIIRLEPGVRFCQLVLFEVTDITRFYSGKYQEQEGATESRLEEDDK
jgi:dCTP deaminase